MKISLTNKSPAPPMSKRDYTLMLNTLNIQSVSGQTERMRLYILRLARSYGATVVEDKGNLYVTKGAGPLYPCYVAHTDTVHDIIPDDDWHIYYDPELGPHYLFGWDDKKGNGQGGMSGIGGDDKCGVFVALAMLRDLPVCKAFFPRDEEVGCQGTHVANMQFFDDCVFAIQCDRRNDADYIRKSGGTDLFGNEFERVCAPVFAKYGFKDSFGSVTDVKTLKDKGLDICAINLSSGYFNPHSDQEIVHIPSLSRTLSLVREMTTVLGADRRWEHRFERPVYTQTWSPPNPKVWTPRVKWGIYHDDDCSEEYERRAKYGQSSFGTSSSQEVQASEFLTCPSCSRVGVDEWGFCFMCQKWHDINDVLDHNRGLVDYTEEYDTDKRLCPWCMEREVDRVSRWCGNCHSRSTQEELDEIEAEFEAYAAHGLLDDNLVGGGLPEELLGPPCAVCGGRATDWVNFAQLHFCRDCQFYFNHSGKFFTTEEVQKAMIREAKKETKRRMKHHA